VASLKSFFDNRETGSLAARMRRQRFAFFLSLFNQVKRPARILDVGGTQRFWEVMGYSNLADLRITLLNLETQPVSSPSFESVAGDARDLSRYADASFDVVFSNSVIEHLGPHLADQQRMANEIRRVGRRYFVQTPNRYFPIEPHFLTPGFQFLPVSVRVWAVTRFNVGWYKRFSDKDEARHEVESISLLTKREVRRIFPGALIYEEKFLGVTKSFVAYGGWTD
jgi:ubiquinone/menaquinone biosynthesis C-methylase UbiE